MSIVQLDYENLRSVSNQLRQRPCLLLALLKIQDVLTISFSTILGRTSKGVLAFSEILYQYHIGGKHVYYSTLSSLDSWSIGTRFINASPVSFKMNSRHGKSISPSVCDAAHVRDVNENCRKLRVVPFSSHRSSWPTKAKFSNGSFVIRNKGTLMLRIQHIMENSSLN